MIRDLAAAVGLCAAVAAQDVFRVERDEDRVLVSAEGRGMSAERAMVELVRALGWELEFSDERTRASLAGAELDLAFADQDPLDVAHLIALAGGADAAFDDELHGGRPPTRVLVVPPQGADTAPGREHSRRAAERWYRACLRLPPDGDEQVAAERGRVRRALADLRDRQAADPKDPARLRRDFPPGQGRPGQGVELRSSSEHGLPGTPGGIDACLLMGRAELALGRPERVLRAVSTLDGTYGLGELDREQWLDYLYLRGFALARLGEHAGAAEALGLFCETGLDDERRGAAFAMLAGAYRASGRRAEALAAAREGFALRSHASESARLEAAELYARAAAELGDGPDALRELEAEFRAAPSSAPELALGLARALVEAHEFERALEVAGLVGDAETPWADRARLLGLRARWGHAKATGAAATFPEIAVPIVDSIEDGTVRARADELLAAVYLELVERETGAAPRGTAPR